MDYTSIKVGQLPTEEISGSDFIPHEVNGLLKKATITDLAAFIGANDAVGFRAVSVPNGGTLPTTDTQEFILVGPGTYNNVGGGSTITVTEELNAIVSNGTYWFVGVEIPIDAPPGNAVWGEIVGTLSNQTDLQSLLNLKADLVAGKVPSSQLPSYVDDVVEVADFAALPVSGETGKIYVTLDSGFIYRWTGTIYVRIADEAAAWGTITGTLSDQTDLQSALNAKADEATTLSINGTSYNLSANRSWNVGTVTGSGNTNYLPKFTSSSAIGDSLIYDNGTNVFVGGSGSNGNRFTVVEGGTTLVGQQILMQNASSANDALNIVHSGTGKLIKGTKGVEVFNITNSGGAYFADNVGIGVTPSAWDTVWKVLQISKGSYYASDYSNIMAHNLYVAGEDTKYISSNLASLYEQNSGSHYWYTAPSGTAGANMTLTPRMILDNSGDVGIGTTSPAAKLDVNGVFRSIVTSISSTGEISAKILGYPTSPFGLIFRSYSSGATSIQSQRESSNSELFPLSLQPLGGNVGIGTTSPSKKLHVKGGNDNVLFLDNGGEQYTTQYFANNGTTKSFLVWDNTSSLFEIGTAVYADLRLLTNNSERMRITSDGKLIIGTSLSIGSGIFQVKTSSANNVAHFQNGTSDAGYGLVFLNVAGSAVGSIGWTNVMTSYNVTSDYRLKEDFKDYSGLDLISKIKTYDYKWKQSEDRMYGVKAHELQEVVPYAVTGEKDAKEMQSVDYSKLVPILVQAIQELKAEIEILKNK